MLSPENCTTLRVREIFHISDNTTFLVCNMDENCIVNFPGDWQLYRDNEYLRNVRLESVVMSGHKTDEKGRQLITFTAPGHIDKSLFNFNKQMLLRKAEDNTAPSDK